MEIIRWLRDGLLRLFRKKEYPVYGTCAVCGERVYLPFHCEYCHRYYCDKHRLPFDHNCKNIDQWKNRPK